MADGLVDELTQRLPATDYYSSNVPVDYPIRKALAILHQGGFATPTRVIANAAKSKRDADELRRSPIQHNMFVDPDEAGQPVHVNTWTTLYDRANRNKVDALRQIAGQFAHEAQHQTGGSDEQAAYGQQLRVLAALGAKDDEMQPVRDAASYVKRMAGK